MSEPRFLSNESISTLRGLLGVSIHTIFATQLDAAGAHLAAWKLSMLLAKDDFVNFSCEWLFHCDDGRAFCIACMLNGPGVAEYLHFSEDQRVIQEMLIHSTSRLCLE